MKMKKILRYPLALLFALFFLVFFVWDMVVSHRIFSETENRYLQLKPEFSMHTLMNGKYTENYEKYINDQFVLRDQWISLKSRVEFAIGKQENNSVVYGKDHYMFDKYDMLDEEQLQTNLELTQLFFEKYPEVPATFAIIPNSYMVMPERLPYGLELIDQYQRIQDLYQQLPDRVNKVSFRETLEAHKDNYIYYMTDHHWTTYGAYLAYGDYVRSRGMEPVPLEDLSGVEVSGFYGTYYSKSKLFNAVADVITYYDIPTTDVTINGEHTILNAQKEEIPVTGLYNLPEFEKRDKYAAFLYGNNGLTVIRSDNNRYHEEGRTARVLVIKDSYGNSLVPYLTYHYDEVMVVDLRGLTTDLSQLMNENSFDDVLFLYNFANYASDTNFPRLKY